jgi:hypothetical protein
MATSTYRVTPPAWGHPSRRRTWRALICCASALSALAGCGKGAGEGGGGLTIAPSSITFAAGEQDPIPAAKTFAIAISNKDAVYVGAAFVGNPPDWLTLGITGQGNSWTLQATVTTTALPPGSYHATVLVGMAGGNKSILGTQDVDVDYTVSAKLGATPSSLVFSALAAGSSTAAQAIAVTGTGLAWTASADAGWIRLAGSSGTGPGSVQVTCDPSSLAAGDYTGTVTLQAAGMPDAPVSVALHVAAAESAALHASPSSLAFSAFAAGSSTAAQAIAVTATSGLAWAASADAGWIHLSASGGAGPGSVQVTCDPSSLAVGDYTGTVMLQAAGVPDVPVSVTLHVEAMPVVLQASPPSRAFSAFEAGPTTAGQAITITATSGLAWTASADAGWIHLDASGGTGSGSVQVTCDPSALAAGDFTGTVTFQAAGVPDVPVSVTFHVSAVTLSIEAQLAFSGKNGAALSTQLLHLGTSSGAALAWNASASDPWIVLDHASGTTSDTIIVGVDAAQGPLASGAHAGSITLSAPFHGRTLTATVDVALTLVKPVLTLQPTSLALGGDAGRDLQAKQVTLSLDTGAVAYPWTASTQSTWLTPSSTTGTVTATPSALTIAPSAAGLTGGAYTGSLGLTVTVNGDLVTATLPVELDLDDHHLVASDTGVAFAKTPSLSSLTRTLKVRDDFGLSTGWTAASNQPWLSVTPSGTAPGDLVLTADPTGLGTDALYLATVTVSPAVGSGIAAAETIQVGLWVGAADPAAATTLSVASTSVVTDPIRPYAYVNAGGTSITVYNVFTTQVVATIDPVAAQLGSMAVSLDGSKLYAVDRTNFRIVPVDLATQTVGTPFAVGAAVGPSIHYARANGKGLILAGNSCIYDADTGAVRYPAGGCTSTSSYPVSSSVMGNIFSIGMIAYHLDHSAMGGGTVLVGSPLSPGVTAYNSEDYAFNEDGSRMYLAVGSPYDFYVVDAAAAGPSLPMVQVLPGAAYPNNVEVARDGRIFTAIFGYADTSGHDAWIFAPDGTQLEALDLTYYGIGTGTLKISGDGLRMVSLPNSAYLTPDSIAFHTTVP